MSKDQCVKCARSASDGNLADVEDEGADNDCDQLCEKYKYHTCQMDKQMFFTLPRWMSRRKKNERKYREIKVDVPLNAKDETEKNVHPQLTLKKKKDERKKNSEKSSGMFTKLFRNFSAFALSGPSVPINSAHVPSVGCNNRTIPRKPVSYLMSASNTDIRSHIIVCDTSECQEYFKDKTPAVCGIRNHGNTCFMNAIIQCLSNTDFFAEYFVMDQYKIDFLRRNKIHSKKYGTKGEVTDQLAVVLKSLWSCQYYPDISHKFKNLVAKYGSQYEGNNQHDAQEFLLWLLDKVHEDLNTAAKQKYKKPKSSHGRPDEDVASETLANHLRCNNSFVHDLFQGQFRSSLSCPGCGRYSNTFDPYLCVSLPVPHRQTTPVFVNWIMLSEDSKMVKLGIVMDSQATMKAVREKLSIDYHIPKQRILLTEFYEGEFHRTFSDFDLICTLNENEELLAIETPLPKPITENEGEYLVLLLVNRIEDEENKVFWRPFTIQVLREATYNEIQKSILAAMNTLVKDRYNPQDTELLFRLRVIDGIPEHDVLPESVDHPLYMPIIDQALILCEDVYHRGPKHVKLAVEWLKEVKEKFIIEKQFLEEDSSVGKLKNLQKKVTKASLYECFELYFTEEKLGLEDAWMCQYCRRRLQGVKQLSLWTVPDVFIVHLKRFRQSFCQRTKVTTLVEFPYLGLDMNPFVAQRNHDLHQHAQNGGLGALAFWSPWKRPQSRPFPRCEDNIYDLYAVCNHHGSMQGGHYTAYCKNPVDGHWYLFDDTKVQLVQDSDVVTADAYILFYQRSSLAAHSCASSSTSGYSTASSVSLMASEHWAYRMPPFLHLMPKTSKSQDNLCDVAGSTVLYRTVNSENRPFTRAGKVYSSMIHFSDSKKISTVVLSKSERHSDSEIPQDEIPPPPPPPAKRYWTITSV